MALRVRRKRSPQKFCPVSLLSQLLAKEQNTISRIKLKKGTNQQQEDKFPAYADGRTSFPLGVPCRNRGEIICGQTFEQGFHLFRMRNTVICNCIYQTEERNCCIGIIF